MQVPSFLVFLFCSSVLGGVITPQSSQAVARAEPPFPASYHPELEERSDGDVETKTLETRATIWRGTAIAKGETLRLSTGITIEVDHISMAYGTLAPSITARINNDLDGFGQQLASKQYSYRSSGTDRYLGDVMSYHIKWSTTNHNGIVISDIEWQTILNAAYTALAQSRAGTCEVVFKINGVVGFTIDFGPE
ncbi:hypothetical protein F4819DRAFT_459398 [Hypoxylon fuscum]|nr:hypothetical protein F4819DRAFT_459398 [Hypoxylon fuscum]